MTLRDYWQLEPDDLENRIYAILKAETAERGYMTGYDIACALKTEWSDAINEALYRLLQEDMITDIPRGSGTYRVKRDKPRHKPDPFTAIFFCGICGTEVYRHAHITRRTQKKMYELRTQSRLALLQHISRVGHHATRLEQFWINERFGDKGFEIPGHEPLDERFSASHFAKVFGILPEEER